MIAVFVIVWNTGAFDRWLYHVGLNKNECGRNLLTGAVFCGDELEAIEERRDELRQRLPR